ncbi:MAG: VWA domain-containing protein [Acidobacteria bacterium]|nr:VWA domain-containing protein [Acidobacteriota bacterium]
MANRKIIHLFLSLLFLASSSYAYAAEIRFLDEPGGLQHGIIELTYEVDGDFSHVILLVNDVEYQRLEERRGTFTLDVGRFLRRLRLRAEVRGSSGALLADREIVINDPRPPFRARLRGPGRLPESGMVELRVSVTKPPGLAVSRVEFFVDEEPIGADTSEPYTASFDAAHFSEARFARVAVQLANGREEGDVFYFGQTRGESLDVSLQQIPVSVLGSLQGHGLELEEISLKDDGVEKDVVAVTRAIEEPLSIVLLIDSSESMLEELPLIKQAAIEFSEKTLETGNAKIAVVAFHQRRFWLTGFTSNLDAIERAVDQLHPVGQTHLYDATIEMLYELQRRPGRRALVVLTDGVNQGGDFELDHVVHYARYSGVPIYPVVRNTLLSRLMRFGLRRFDANRYAEIARDSGARWFIVSRPDDLPSVYRAIAHELSQQYLVSFYADDAGTDRWHTLELRTSREGVDLRAPRGYFPD